MKRIEDYIIFLMAKAFQHTNKCAKDALRPFGVTPTQYAVLSVLWEKDGRSGVEIAGRVILDSAAITGLLDRMVSTDLITRKPDEDDGRVNRIWLTNKGSGLEKELTQIIDKLDDQFRADIGAKNDTAISILRQLGGLK